MSPISRLPNILLGITILIAVAGCSVPEAQTETTGAGVHTSSLGSDPSNAAGAAELPLESRQVATTLREDIINDLAIRLEDQLGQDG